MRNGLWRRILADALGIPAVSTGEEQGSALGAALLALRARGGDLPPGGQKSEREVTRPHPPTAALYEQLYTVYRTLYPALRPAMHQLAAWHHLAGQPAAGAGDSAPGVDEA
jgi:xylulokinase